MVRSSFSESLGVNCIIYTLPNILFQVWWHAPLIPTPERKRQVDDLCEFQGGESYTVRDPVSIKIKSSKHLLRIPRRKGSQMLHKAEA